MAALCLTMSRGGAKMLSVNKPLLTLTAGELMNHEIVAVPRDMSVQAAASLLRQNQISGAPVVDADGRCIGVLSANDFVRWTERRPAAPIDPGYVCSRQVIGELEEFASEAVTACMTRDVVTVRTSTPIGRLARLMLDAHIHRVIVVDENDRPVGIVSSTDVLAAVAYADAAYETQTDSGSFMTL
jgi:CBS domain-containing protein